MDNFDLRLRKLAAAEKEILPSFVENRIQSVLSSLPDKRNASVDRDGDRNIDADDIVRYIDVDIMHNSPGREKKKENRYKKLLPGLKSMVEVALLVVIVALVPISLMHLGGGAKKSSEATTDKSLGIANGSQKPSATPAGSTNSESAEKPVNLVSSTVPFNGEKNLSRTKTKIVITFNSEMPSDMKDSPHVKVINEDESKDITGRFNFSYNGEQRSLELVSKSGRFDADMGNSIGVTVMPGLKDNMGYIQSEAFTFHFSLDKNVIYDEDKADAIWEETLVTGSCALKSGPGDSYADIGSLKYGGTVLLKGEYNGWCLINIEGSKDGWIKGTNILKYDFDHTNDQFGVVTVEELKVGNITFHKGNLIWILKKDEEKSYIRPVAIDIHSGYSGWIKNSDYTTKKTGVYFNQAFIKKDTKVYKDASESSEVFTEFYTLSGGYVFIDLEKEGWAAISAFGGINGWVKKSELYIP